MHTPRGVWTAKAIIFFEKKLLLQLRDSNAEIFFPNHWGLFGGEVESGEGAVDALERELHEELGLGEFYSTPLRLFSWISRENESKLDFFLVRPEVSFDSLVLHEGQAMGLFGFTELSSLRLTPDLDQNLSKIEDCFRQFTS